LHLKAGNGNTEMVTKAEKQLSTERMLYFYLYAYITGYQALERRVETKEQEKKILKCRNKNKPPVLEFVS